MDCKECGQYWTETDLLAQANDNEDRAIVMASLDYCPDCIGQYFGDYDGGE